VFAKEEEEEEEWEVGKARSNIDDGRRHKGLGMRAPGARWRKMKEERGGPTLHVAGSVCIRSISILRASGSAGKLLCVGGGGRST